jgi:ribonuclease HII
VCRFRTSCWWTRSRAGPTLRPVGTVVAAAIARLNRRQVTRDRMMLELHARDPRYGFDRHKGYATQDHLDAVLQFGYSDVHRRSFRPPSLFDRME